VLLDGINQEYQGWNNCGPATLKMNLSYFGREDTQQEIAAITKPDANDKSVSAQELAGYAQRVGMGAIVRENGSIEVLKQLVSHGLPVIVESGYLPSSGWMSHFLLLIGYDEQHMTFMDSYAGPNQSASYDTMETRWREVNRRYLVVYPPEKEQAVRAILGDELNDAVMYTRAVERARTELAANPKDAFAYYNLGTNLIGLEDAAAAASAFDQARKIGLPWRMLWYQYGAYVAYLNTGRYQDVIELANNTLHRVANLEESHYYKGMALKSLGQLDAARREFRMALRYNPNYQEAQSALQAALFQGA
jgi:tetratricopeptide (TPR) repeat protein